MSTITDSDRILAAGVPLQLAGGEARLRFDFRSYRRLEESFGSIKQAAEKLNRIWTIASGPELNEPIIDDLSVFLGAGLQLEPDDALEQLTADDVASGLVVAAAACIQAWTEAFPQTSAEGNEGEPPAMTPSGSPGPMPTGSSPASQDDAMATSGA